MAQASPAFRRPSSTEQFINKCIGRLVDWGMGPKYMQVLEVAGRKSGKIYRTPVNLMQINDALYLVAPRGETNWVRNARHAKSITLKRGNKRTHYSMIELPAGEKAAILKEYLERYKSEVQKYFDIEAGSDLSAFKPVVDRYPVMQLEKV